jgi:hypothetical protein
MSLHTDAAQSVGNLPTKVGEFGAGLLRMLSRRSTCLWEWGRSSAVGALAPS